MDKIKTIISKEWSEVFKNRLVLFSVAFLPLFFIILPLLTIAGTSGIDDEVVQAAPADTNFTETSGLPGAETYCQGLTELECVQVYTINLFSFMFMILPVAIPVTIAAYSVVGEKAAHSLEPLLATPITTIELLTGKALAAAIPAVVATWLSYLIYAFIAYFLATPVVFRAILQPMWLLAIFVVGPLLTLLAVCVAIIVSSRVTDPRVAEQLSMVVMLPIIMVIIGQSVGVVLLDSTMVILLGVVVLVLDVVLGYVSIRAFQRENILTRWK